MSAAWKVVHQPNPDGRYMVLLEAVGFEDNEDAEGFAAELREALARITDVKEAT